MCREVFPALRAADQCDMADTMPAMREKMRNANAVSPAQECASFKCLRFLIFQPRKPAVKTAVKNPPPNSKCTVYIGDGVKSNIVLVKIYKNT